MAASQNASPSRRESQIFYGWFVLATLTFSLCMTFGTTTSIGFFFIALQNEFGWNRAVLSGSVSLAYLVFAFLSPVVGRFLDRFGSRPVLFLGISAIAAAFMLLGLTNSLWHMYLFYGVLVGIGGVCTAFVPIATCVMQWFRKRRGTALGIANSGAPLGQLLVVPLASYLILLLGWRTAFPTMGLIVLVTALPLVYWIVRNKPEDMGLQPDGEPAGHSAGDSSGAKPQTRLNNLEHLDWRGALRTTPFWLLASSYFTCGFTVMLFAVHFPSYVTDKGFDVTTATQAVAVAGFCNVFGTLFSGAISDRIGSKNPLAASYFVRGISFLFFAIWQNNMTLYIFAVMTGFSWFATVPPTATLTREIYGPRNVGFLYGSITGLHQVGSAVGAFTGGFVFDLTGSYTPAFVVAAILLLTASALSFSIREGYYRQPVPAVT
ncbi:MAG: MFS transporter [Nitrospinota bacterium]